MTAAVMPLRAALLAAVLLGGAILQGCTTTDRAVALTEETVTPLSAGEPTEVSAGTLAEAMLRAGFSREQILSDGPQVRNAIAQAGGAQVREGRMIAALFAIQDSRLIVTSRMRGTFVLPLP